MAEMTSPIRHSEACGVNPQTDCPDCKPHTIRLRTLEALEERLRRGGGDFGLAYNSVYAEAT
jgi:hypothetical protein